jgi:SAM-dependent methyltransferase
MVPYRRSPDRTLRIDDRDVASFVSADARGLNADLATVASFGEEWNRFATFTEEETRVAGDEVFDLVTNDIANASTVALDIGCGTGRWSLYLAPHVQFIEAVDPGDAVRAAARLTRTAGNIRVTQAGYGGLPFAPGSFDLVFSLGVVHHLPDTEQAIREAASMVRPGGWLLLYIYYAFDNRGALFRSLFPLANGIRRVVSRMPARLKFLTCDALATVVYLPFVGAARLARAAGIRSWAKVPLSYYVGKPWKIIRNDSLDRFGTPLEKRFTQDAIRGMLERTGLTDIRFSASQPFWHVVARR